mgnify:FL=1
MSWLYRIKNYFSKRLLGMTIEDIALLKSEVSIGKARITELKDEASFWRMRSQCHQDKIQQLEDLVADLTSRKDSVFSHHNITRYLMERDGCLSSLTKQN